MSNKKLTRKEIEQKVKEILADRLDVDINKIRLDSDLVEDFGMDSFGAVEVLYGIEDTFNIEVVEDDFAKKSKVSDVVDYISKKLEKRKG